MRDIKQLHPRLQLLVDQLIHECAEQGINIKIGECLRTVDEQNALYAQGRTAPGNIVTNAKGDTYSSQHQWGIAFDFYLNEDVDGDGQTSDDAFNNSTKLFNQVGQIGKSLGLGWGGDWKSFVDQPHFYLPDWGSTTSVLRSLYGSPTKFMETWYPAADTIKAGFRYAGDDLWRYQYADGTYAADDWHWLTEATGGTSAWYLFRDEIMLTGYQTAPNGERFFLCPEKGIHEGKCMVTDERGVLVIPKGYDFENHRFIL